MLVDFCHYSIGSSIKTDKVSFDGYEINNLIASNSQQKNQGFLSDHFIKPPVNITVQFPCNISVDRVVIDPVIGQQRSHDIKIFTASNRMTDTWLYGGDNKTVKSDGLMFNQVGYVSQTNPSVVCLQNRRFQESRLWRQDDRQNCCSVRVTGELRSNKPGALTNASHLNICVLRTKSGCSVAIKRLEIWGIPATTVPNDLQEKLKKCYIDALYPSSTSDRSSNKNTQGVSNNLETNVGSENQESVNSTEDVIIPEDFKDEITWEIMACPVVLPSGKFIDQSTLDRFVNTEASWGRPPSDPFTGLDFTQGRQPIPNSALKTRIDDFTFKHADLLTVAKTLGRADRKSAGLITSSRLTNVQQTYGVEHLGSTSGSPINSSDYLDFPPSLQNRKRKQIDNYVEIKQSKFIKPSQELVSRGLDEPATVPTPDCTVKSKSIPQTLPERSGLSVVSRSTAATVTASKQSVPKVSRSHNSALSCSLNDALKDALGGLPSFTARIDTNDKHSTCTLYKRQGSNQSSEDKSEHKSKNDLVCHKCGVDCTASTVIKYRISCGHLVCRNCVNSQTRGSMSCTRCKMKYSRDELVRVF